MDHYRVLSLEYLLIFKIGAGREDLTPTTGVAHATRRRDRSSRSKIKTPARSTGFLTQQVFLFCLFAAHAVSLRENKKPSTPLRSSTTCSCPGSVYSAQTNEVRCFISAALARSSIIENVRRRHYNRWSKHAYFIRFLCSKHFYRQIMYDQWDRHKR